MEYNIISGSVIETRRCWMTERDGRNHVRGQRKAGNTSLAKIRMNEQEAVRNLARTLNTNFGKGFLFLTLKYSNDRLPADYEAAQKSMKDFIRKARAAYEKQGMKLRYVGVTANWSPKRQCQARLHHHLILDIASLDMLQQLWPAGEFYVKVVNNPSDLTQLASYLIANVHGLPKGANKWSVSRGMQKPIYTEPKPVEYIDVIQPLPNTAVVDAQQTIGEDGEVIGSYMRMLSFEPVKVRGGMIILPRKRKRDPQPKTMDEAIYQNDD